MSLSAILRAAPVATSAELMEPEAVRHHEMYASGSLKPLPGHELTDIPIRIDHMKDPAPIGCVTFLRTDPDLPASGGTWIWVHAEITDPPAWLKKGTPVSIARAAYSHREEGGWDYIREAILTEVSILSPGLKPAFPRAQVTWMGESERSPAAAPSTSDRAVAGEVVIPPVLVKRTARGSTETDELDRRLEMIERLTGRPADFELVLSNLQEEIHGRSLDREFARLVAARGR